MMTLTKKAPATAVPPSLTRIASEAELLRMPESTYMNEAQLLFFRTRLIELQRELVERANETADNLRDMPSAPDPSDRATIEEEHALDLRTRDRERKLLRKIEAALARIDEGSYGYCGETAEPIGLRRLLARPTATLTVEAQERLEIRRKGYGD